MTEQEQQRLVKRRLAIIQHAQEVTGNVAYTCRYFGISRHTYYYWLRRYERRGSRAYVTGHVGRITARTRPRRRWWARSSIRQSHHFGPGKISMYLKRYHEISISPSGVWRVLQRLESDRCWARWATLRDTEGAWAISG